MDPTTFNQVPLIEYYQILEVSKDVDEETLKKAYKKMALKYHPDKAGNSAEAVEKFQNISKAYHVLTDPKKRKIYDRYGSRGIAMMEQMGEVAPFIDPDMVLAMNWMFFLGSIIFGLMIIFTAFISVRADEIISWAWPVVFIPAFILDVFLILGLLKLPDKPINLPEENEEETRELSEEERQRREKSKRERLKRKIKRFFSIYLGKLLRLTYVNSFILFQIFIALKLQNIINWSWGFVFIPWFVLEGFHFFVKLFGIVLSLKTGKVSMVSPSSDTEENNDDDDEHINMVVRPYSLREKLKMIWNSYFPWVLRVVQAVLIILKLEGPLGFQPWRIIFVPFYLIGILKFLNVIYAWYRSHYLILDSTTEYQQLKVQANVGLSIAIFVICGFLFYLGLGLLVQRLDSGGSGIPTTAVIFIPIFIVLSLLFCCFCCCLPCLASTTRRMMEEELNRPDATDATVAAPDKRIVWISTPSPKSSQENLNQQSNE